MTSEIAIAPLAAQAFKSDYKPIWCPGCGDYSVLSSITKAFAMLELRPENIAVGGAGAERNLAKGKIAFAAYLGNTLRYDVDLGQGITFKVDDRDPWHHEQRAMGSVVELGFSVASTLAIPAA